MRAGSRIGGLRFGCIESDVDVLHLLTPSLASQLPQISLVFTKFVFTGDPCGSWLASDER
jgi:hypothetical protein